MMRVAQPNYIKWPRIIWMMRFGIAATYHAWVFNKAPVSQSIRDGILG